MPKLLNKIVSNQINKMIDQDEYGILIANLPSLDVNELCEFINLDKKKISFFIIGAEDNLQNSILSKKKEKIDISFSVEEAEESRNSGDDSVFRIIVLKRNDIQKVSSLEWFNKITMSDLYKYCCQFVNDSMPSTNAFIKAFVNSLKQSDLKRVLNFEDVIDFLDGLYNANEKELQNYIVKNLYKLGFAYDNSITTIVDTTKLKQRLKDNKSLVNNIGDLDKNKRLAINKYAEENPLDDTPKFILDYYKFKNKNILSKIDYEKAILCLKKSGKVGGASRNKAEKYNPTAFASKIVFDDKINEISEMLSKVEQDFSNASSKKTSELFIKDNSYGTTFKFDIDSAKIVDSFVGKDIYGCVFYFDADSPSDALSKCDKYNSFFIDDKKLQDKVFSRLLLFKEYGYPSSISSNLKVFLEKRKAIIKYKERLNDYAMLQIIEKSDDFNQYLMAYEKLLTSIETDYRSLSDYDSDSTKEIVSYIMSLDFVYFISKENASNTYAIPTSVNVLYLWKYIKLAQEILDSRNISDPNELNYLSESDRDFIIRKAEDIPNPLTLFCVPSVITDGLSVMLPLNGNLGALPVFSAKQLIDDSYSNSNEIISILNKYIALYPHSCLNIKIAFVNPPSVDLIAKVLNQFDQVEREEYSFDILILKTRASSRDWVTIDEDTLNAGIFGKLKNEHTNVLNLKVIDKEIDYTNITDYLENDRHLLFMFDPNEKKIEMSTNVGNMHISPLCVPKVYEYNPIQNTRKISAADSETIFSLYTIIIEKIKDQTGASIRHSKVYTYSPLKEETYHSILEKADWVVIFDKNLKTWDIALNSSSEKLYFSESDTRSVGIYSKNANKLIKGYTNLLKNLGNFFPTEYGLNNLINQIRTVNNDGLLSIISKASNRIFDQNQGKGSLALAISTMIYKMKYPDAIIVGLDTQLARIWLSGREQSILPDLVALRRINENDDFIVDIIEVKSYEEYALSNGAIQGHCIEQVNALVSLLKEMFSKNERITTVARREILREQVYEYIFNFMVPKDNKNTEQGKFIQTLLKAINKLFSGNVNYSINKNISHVEFANNENRILMCKTTDCDERDILLNIIGTEFISKIISGEQIDSSRVPFFNAENTGFYYVKHDDVTISGTDGQENFERKSYTKLSAESLSTQAIFEDFNDDSDRLNEGENIESNDVLSGINRDTELIKNNCKNLYTILKDYGVKVKEINNELVQVTSRFYRFKVELFSGETIRTIEKYKDDISRGLAAQGPIMISNVPGTKYIAIDVCYDLNPAPLSLLSNITKLDGSNGKLDILAGESVDGTFRVIDLADAVHMLIAGTTGSGKTLFIYSLICSLLYKHDERELEFIFVDPKQTDFVFFSDLKACYKNKIITDPKEAIDIIKWINETERPRRIEMFKSCKARDILSYNSKNPDKKMKRIVLIIDEYADLVRTADNLGIRKEFENSLSQAAAMVRSLGIHIILATQWASASIVTSAIKANFPFRISFKLPQHQDSSTILDRSGAEDLLGKGDMLILENGALLRLQSCYIDADNEMVGFLKKYE